MLGREGREVRRKRLRGGGGEGKRREKKDGRAREEEGEEKEDQVLKPCGWYWTLNMNGPKAFTHW